MAITIGRRSGPLLPLTVLVLAQGLRASSELSLPLSCGHDLASVWLLAWPAAFGGGALLTALCGLSAYALSHGAQQRKQALIAFFILLISAAGHEILRPTQQQSVVLKASVIMPFRCCLGLKSYPISPVVLSSEKFQRQILPIISSLFLSVIAQ